MVRLNRKSVSVLLAGFGASALLGGPLASLVRANESVTTVTPNGFTCSATGGHENFNVGGGFMGFHFNLGAGGSTGLPEDPALQACQLLQFAQDETNFAAYAASITQQEDEDSAEALALFTIFLLGEGPGGGISFQTADRLRENPIQSLSLIGVLLRNGGEVGQQAPAQAVPPTQAVQERGPLPTPQPAPVTPVATAPASGAPVANVPQEHSSWLSASPTATNTNAVYLRGTLVGYSSPDAGDVRAMLGGNSYSGEAATQAEQQAGIWWKHYID